MTIKSMDKYRAYAALSCNSTERGLENTTREKFLLKLAEQLGITQKTAWFFNHGLILVTNACMCYNGKYY